MTITNQTNRVEYTGNGVATNFPFSFPVYDEDHIVVTRITIQDGTESIISAGSYTVNGVDNPAGGSIDYSPALSSSYELRIERIVPYTQETDIHNQGAFLPEVIEEQLDILVMQIIQLKQLVADGETDLEDAIELLEAQIEALLLTLGTADPVVKHFASRAAAILVSINPAVTEITTGGYYVAGDLGGARYKKVVSEPSHIAKFQSADGAWWELAEPVPNVRMFGAKGDGTTNDQAAIQGAIDYLKPAGEVDLIVTRTLKFTTGIYGLSTPITNYSGVYLTGERQATTLKALAGFSGAALVLLKGQGANQFHSQAGIIDMTFQCTGAVWAVAPDGVDFVLKCTFQNLSFNCGFCLALNIYTQSCIIDNLYSNGPLNQLLHLKGNDNTIDHIDKEGSSGSTADPYILVEEHASGRSAGNTFGHILLEQTTSANKTLMSLLGCSLTTIQSLWLEPTLTDGYVLRINDCIETVIYELPLGVQPTLKIKIDDSLNTVIGRLDVDGVDTTISAGVEIDTFSDLTIQRLYTTRGREAYLLEDIAKNIFVESSTFKTVVATALTGYAPVGHFQYVAGQSLAINGSFESGKYGWGFSTAPTATEEYIASEVAQGLMGHFVWSVQGNHSLSQAIAVQAGTPYTLTALVKMTDGTGWINPYITNSGTITLQTGYMRADVDTGWQVVTVTVVPDSTGNYTFGFFFVNAIEVYIDQVSISVGNAAVLPFNRMGSLELNGRSITYGSAAPATGTHKDGDIVFNNAPAAAGEVGWVCTTPGSPGTWKTFGTIAA